MSIQWLLPQIGTLHHWRWLSLFTFVIQIRQVSIPNSLHLLLKSIIFKPIFVHHIIILHSAIMTEPNIVRNKRQRIKQETAGNFFRPLPKHYGRF